MAKSVLRHYRAIPNDDPVLQTVDPDTGESRPATDQELADRHPQPIHVEYRGTNVTVCLVNGWEDDEFPGTYICGRVGMTHAKRKQLLHAAIQAHPKSNPSGAVVNSGFDHLTRSLPEESITEDDEGNPITPPVFTEFERFERNTVRLGGVR